MSIDISRFFLKPSPFRGEKIEVFHQGNVTRRVSERDVSVVRILSEAIVKACYGTGLFCCYGPCYYDHMKIISWNVNGIRSVHKRGLFLPFIEKYQPDILCLQETKAERGQVVIDLPNYEESWNSADKKGYSGTAIFTKIKPISVINGIPEKICQK